MVAQQVQEQIEVIEQQYQQELAAREENWNNQVAEFQDREHAWLQQDKEAQARLLALQTELEVPKDQTHPIYFLTFFLSFPSKFLSVEWASPFKIPPSLVIQLALTTTNLPILTNASHHPRWPPNLP